MMLGKLKDFLLSERSPLWLLVVSGIVSFVVSAGTQYAFYRHNIGVEEQRIEASRISAELQALKSNSQDFQTFAGAFVSAVLDGDDDVDGRREALLANILSQDAAIDVAVGSFDPRSTNAAQSYRAALLNMKEAVDQVDDVISMGAFWEAASDLLLARNELISALEDQMLSPSS